MPNANRVLKAVERISARLRELDDEKLKMLIENTSIDFEEHFTYQQAQVWAHANGLITPEEANTIYMSLGEAQSSTNGGWQPEVRLAMKIAVMQIVGEILKKKIAA